MLCSFGRADVPEGIWREESMSAKNRNICSDHVLQLFKYNKAAAKYVQIRYLQKNEHNHGAIHLYFLLRNLKL